MAHSHAKQGLLNIDAHPGVPFDCDQKDPRGSTEDSALWVCLATPYHRAWAATLPFFDEVFLVSWARNRIALACKSSPHVAWFKRQRYLAALRFGTESSTCTCWTQTRSRAIGYTVQVSKKKGAHYPSQKNLPELMHWMEKPFQAFFPPE